jgi:prevent-host-death family protein
MIWPVSVAKSRLSEFVDAALNDGPQVVSRHGVETAVLVSITEWSRSKSVGPADAQGDSSRPKRSAF